MFSLGTRLGAFFAMTCVRHARGICCMHAVVCNGCHHAHYIFRIFLLVVQVYIYIVPKQFEFVVILARISYVCSSAKRGHHLGIGVTPFAAGPLEQASGEAHACSWASASCRRPLLAGKQVKRRDGLHGH